MTVIGRGVIGRGCVGGGGGGRFAVGPVNERGGSRSECPSDLEVACNSYMIIKKY